MILNFETNTGIDYQENSTEVYRHQRNINVFVVVVITGNNNIQVTAVWWYLHLCHVPRQIYYFLVHPFFVPGNMLLKSRQLPHEMLYAFSPLSASHWISSLSVGLSLMTHLSQTVQLRSLCLMILGGTGSAMEKEVEQGWQTCSGSPPVCDCHLEPYTAQGKPNL